YNAPASLPVPGLKQRRNRAREALPFLRFALELAAPRPGQRIKFGASIILAWPPLRLDPTAVLQLVEGRIKGTIAHIQHVVGHLIQPAADRPAMHGLMGQDSQKQKIQGALNEVAGSTHGYREESSLLLSMSKRNLSSQFGVTPASLNQSQRVHGRLIHGTSDIQSIILLVGS